MWLGAIAVRRVRDHQALPRPGTCKIGFKALCSPASAGQSGKALPSSPALGQAHPLSWPIKPLPPPQAQKMDSSGLRCSYPVRTRIWVRPLAVTPRRPRQKTTCACSFLCWEPADSSQGACLDCSLRKPLLQRWMTGTHRAEAPPGPPSHSAAPRGGASCLMDGTHAASSQPQGRQRTLVGPQAEVVEVLSFGNIYSKPAPRERLSCTCKRLDALRHSGRGPGVQAGPPRSLLGAFTEFPLETKTPQARAPGCKERGVPGLPAFLSGQ